MNKVPTPFGQLHCLAYRGLPMDLARQLRSRPGFVFLDSALISAVAQSVLAVDPIVCLQGSIWNVDDLKGLNDHVAHLVDPSGLIGCINFDGEFCFGVYKHIWLYDHAKQQWLGTSEPDEVAIIPIQKCHIESFHSLIGRASFLNMVRSAQEYIAAGDIYQVCLSHPFEANFIGDPWGFYEQLRQFSPAPHAAFLQFPIGCITSASPETFLEIRQRDIVTRPIKGTRPRSQDVEVDTENAHELKASEKENAELLMITDLERNDLGKICEYGSVNVTSFNALEHFQQVHHLVSTIKGTLREEVSHVDALQACFPGGSISGAPKHRALEIIAELEVYSRGLYTGAIGYFGAGKISMFNIAIRTAVFKEGKVVSHSGAGIVSDSNPEAEWDETCIKAKSILGAAEAMYSH